MKKTIFAIAVVCLIFLSACTSTPGDEAPLVEPSEQAPETRQNTTTPGSMQLSQSDIDSICGGLYRHVYHCGDGSDVLVFGISYAPYETAYIRYVPARMPNGGYEFFRKLTPSPDVSYDDGGAVIPLCLNDSGDYRFALTVEFSAVDEGTGITGLTFSFLDDGDKEFNEMFAALEYDGKDAYCASLVPDENLTDEELTELFKACAYNGNTEVLGKLYNLIPGDDADAKHRLELAAAITDGSGVELSPDNPYKPEIFYGESCENFPKSEILDIAAKSLQAYKSLEELGAELVEPNYDWESVCKIPNLKDYMGYVYEDERVLGVYKLDIDYDGLQEILIFTPGGSMGNVFWAILHLDKAELVTALNTGEGMRDLSLYRYNEDYFFTSYIIDFYDKEFEGRNVYTLDENSKVYRADVYYDKIDAFVVFDKKLGDAGERYYLSDWDVYGYVSKYKRYEYESVGRPLVPDEKIKDTFNGSNYAGSIYGTIDFNNDGIDDMTNVYMFFPSNRLPYFCNYNFVDGATGRLLDFSEYFRAQAELRRVIPYDINGKTYFVCVLGGYGNYVIKLIEISGIEPVELQCMMVSVESRVMAEVSESTESYWGI